MIFGSVCSGIEAASVAWEPLGWRGAFCSEVAPFPRALLQHRLPGVPLHGDFTTINAGDYQSIDLLIGGTPCQDFSIAGLRAGITGERGNLTLEFIRLAERLLPRWLVWENVPGVLSLDGGRTFGSILGLLGQLGYGFAYRVCDARYYGVPQSRRRVFVVAYLGDWTRAAAVLFERASLRRDLTTGQGPRPDTAIGTLGGTSSGNGWRVGADEAAAGELVVGALSATGVGTCGADDNQAQARHPISHALSAHGGPHGRIDAETETFVYTLASRGRGDGHQLETRDDGVANAVLTPTGGRGGVGVGAVAFSYKDDGGYAGDTAPTMRTLGHAGSHANAGGHLAVATRSAVRRLTPLECERLQGFPDGWTDIPFRGKPVTDGHRYRALGNSMAVPVIRWIGERISLVERLHQPDRINHAHDCSIRDH